MSDIHQCSTSTVKMDHCLYVTCGICIIASNLLWEIHQSFYLPCVKCIIVSTSPTLVHAWLSFLQLETSSWSPLCLWQMDGNLYFTCGKSVIVSTSPVKNASFTLHNLNDTHHVLHFTSWKFITVLLLVWKCSTVSISSVGNASLSPNTVLINASLSLFHLIEYYLFSVPYLR